MPSPTSARFQRVDAVFDAVLELPAEEQAAYIERTCSEDPALRDEVLQLLKAHHHVGGILDTRLASLSPVFGEVTEGPDGRCAGSG